MFWSLKPLNIFAAIAVFSIFNSLLRTSATPAGISFLSQPKQDIRADSRSSSPSSHIRFQMASFNPRAGMLQLMGIDLHDPPTPCFNHLYRQGGAPPSPVDSNSFRVTFRPRPLNTPLARPVGGHYGGRAMDSGPPEQTGKIYWPIMSF